MSKNTVDLLLSRRRMGQVYQFASMAYWQKPVKANFLYYIDYLQIMCSQSGNESERR